MAASRHIYDDRDPRSRVSPAAPESPTRSARSAGPAKHEKPIPTGRLRRTVKVGELVGGQAIRGYATRAANLTRSESARQGAGGRRPGGGGGKGGADSRRT